MSERDKARPVSGEIMAGARSERDLSRPDEFSDAEFETVGATAPQPQSARFNDPATTSGMDLLRQPLEPAAKAEPQRGGPIFWVLGMAMVALAFWVSGGHALVRQAAILVPAEVSTPLRIADVKSRVETHGGRSVLFVDGHAENHGGGPAILPGMEILVTGNDGGITHYRLATSGAKLAPGERYEFSSRLAAPADGVKSISVAFLEGQD